MCCNHLAHLLGSVNPFSPSQKTSSGAQNPVAFN
nr:MAG TPA: hypothetical protein [Caudoviricetes sp.]